MNEFTKPIEWIVSPDTELVFHYTKLSTALELILHTGKIRFGDLCDTNDPYEKSLRDIEPTLPRMCDHSEIEYIKTQKIINEVHRRCRLFCTTEDNLERVKAIDRTNLGRGYSIPSLWAHYAEGHKGICLVFNKNKLCKSVYDVALTKQYVVYKEKIKYGDPPGYFNSFFDLDVNNMNEIHSDLISLIDKHHDIILYTKDLMWEYENEFRIVVICLDDEPFEIDISDSIVGVVLGSQFPDCYSPLIIKAKNDYKIKSARIEWSFGMPYLFPWPN